MRVLITGGGCEEPIDGVRSVCNFSSGRTAAFLCDYFASRGNEVTAIIAERAAKPESAEKQEGNTRVHRFRTWRNLAETLRQQLEENSFDLVLHAAAVSDYRPDIVEINGVAYPAGNVPKIESGSNVIVTFAENPKIIDSLKEWSRNKRCEVVGFKLTNGASLAAREEKTEELFHRANPELVVSNDLSEISQDGHPTRCYARNHGKMECVFAGRTKAELAEFLAGRYMHDKGAIV